MRWVICAAAVAMVSACGQTAAPAADRAASPAPDVFADRLALAALTAEDVSGRLSGELGCSFSAAQEPLMIAMGNVDPTARSEALVKRDGAVAQLPAVAVGGYDGMVEGASFEGGGLLVEVRTIARRETGNEQVAYAATLTARADGAERSYEGVWTCGP